MAIRSVLSGNPVGEYRIPIRAGMMKLPVSAWL
jgi:hypothetical protein